MAHEFYERHGGMAIVFARFLPIVRTLAPFVAGVAEMEIHRLLFFAAVASAPLGDDLPAAPGTGSARPRGCRTTWRSPSPRIMAASALPGFIIYLVHRMRRRRDA